MMFDQLTNHGMLEAMTIDRITHRLTYKDYPNRYYMNYERIWRNWLV